MARACAARPAAAVVAAAAAVGRYDECRAHDVDFAAEKPPQPAELERGERPGQWGEHARADPVQGVSVQRGERLHDLLRARVLEYWRRVSDNPPDGI